MRKKQLLLIIALLILLPSLVYGQDVKIIYKNNYLYLDSPIVIEKGNSLLAIRPMVKLLGGDIKWNQEDRSMDITIGEGTYKLKNNSSLVKSSQGDIKLPVEVKLVNGVSMVASSFLTDAFNLDLGWDSQNRTILIESDRVKEYKENSYFDQSDFKNLKVLRTILEDLRKEVIVNDLDYEFKDDILNIITSYGSISLDEKNREYYNQYGGIVRLEIDQALDLGDKFLKGIKVGDSLESVLDNFPRMGESNLTDKEEMSLDKRPYLYSFSDKDKIYLAEELEGSLIYKIIDKKTLEDISSLKLSFEDDILEKIELNF